MIPRRKSVRRVSPARRALNAIYHAMAEEWLSRPENHKCAVPGCRDYANDVHHTRGRVGSLLTNAATWIPVCRPHHTLIHNNPAWAQQTMAFAGTERQMPLLASGRAWNSSRA